MSRKSRQGKLFESEISRSLKALEARYPDLMWWRRIPDYRDWVQINPRLHKPKAPADFEVLFSGVYHLIECKSCRGKRFDMHWLRPHQRQALLKVEKCGGHGWILFSKRLRPVRGCALNILDYVALEVAFRNQGRKSIPVEEMLKHGIFLERHRGLWNLEPVFMTQRR